jgi:hypothetical protein
MAKSNPLFDTLNFICTKQYKWEELPEECRKGYSQFMINRFISSYEYLIPLANELSIQKLTDKQHYTILYTWVKKTKHYFNYTAYKVEKDNLDLMIAIKKEYNIGNKEAKRYNKLLNNELREKLLKKWHDYIVFVNSKK